MKTTFRIISLIMLVIAVIFVACALSAPNLGQTIQIGSFRFGAQQCCLRHPDGRVFCGVLLCEKGHKGELILRGPVRRICFSSICLRHAL